MKIAKKNAQVDGELSQRGREKFEAGNSGRDFLERGKWNTPKIVISH